MNEARTRGRLPAFGRELVEAQRAGRNVPWLLIALDWNIGRAMPRVVAVSGAQDGVYDLALVRGLACLVAHRGEPQRALEIAELALRSGARCCPIFDAGRGAFMATADILSVRGLRGAA